MKILHKNKKEIFFHYIIFYFTIKTLHKLTGKGVARIVMLPSQCCLALLRTNNEQVFRFLG